MFDFYDEHADQFVTDYAATNPAEDMSETFAAFVLAPSLPDGDTVAEQKVPFFSQFEDLMGAARFDSNSPLAGWELWLRSAWMTGPSAAMIVLCGFSSSKTRCSWQKRSNVASSGRLCR